MDHFQSLGTSWPRICSKRCRSAPRRPASRSRRSGEIAESSARARRVVMRCRIRASRPGPRRRRTCRSGRQFQPRPDSGHRKRCPADGQRHRYRRIARAHAGLDRHGAGRIVSPRSDLRPGHRRSAAGQLQFGHRRRVPGTGVISTLRVGTVVRGQCAVATSTGCRIRPGALACWRLGPSCQLPAGVRWRASRHWRPKVSVVCWPMP